MSTKQFVCPPSKCTGCAVCACACKRGAISLSANKEGFLYPTIEETLCVSCELCQKSCPILYPTEGFDNGTCYAAWSLDNDIRSHSSSGGIFSELARYVILQEGIVVGASLDDRTGLVHHIIITKLSDLYLIQGSKYVQSIITPELLNQVKTELNKGALVFFTGTPCQVAGIKSLTKNPENLYTMDVVCHGVPSPKWFQQIHQRVRSRIKGFTNYNFRKLSSWEVCSNVNVSVNGIIKNRDLLGVETCFQDAFLKGYLHRINCYHCQYANTKRVSDITVADFWGIGEMRPIKDDYKSGCSMMLVNTLKGRNLYDAIQDRIYSELRDISETIDAGNEQLQKPSNKPSERDHFYFDAYSMSLPDLIAKYNLRYNKEPSMWIRIKSRIKHILVTVFE